MPIHDWTRVDAGIFHAFHHSWIEELARILNRRLLPRDYYALSEQYAGGFGPDVLTLQQGHDDVSGSPLAENPSGSGTLLVPPRLKPIAESDLAFYRRKQKVIAIRHVSGDRVVAMIEAGRSPLRAFVQKAGQLLEAGVHLLVMDLFPPSKRDPNGIHGEIWQEIAGEEYVIPAGKPLALISYEAGDTVRVYLENVAVGESLPSMPLFLERERAIDVPVELTYNTAFAEVPRRWREVLEPAKK